MKSVTERGTVNAPRNDGSVEVISDEDFRLLEPAAEDSDPGMGNLKGILKILATLPWDGRTNARSGSGCP